MSLGDLLKFTASFLTFTSIALAWVHLTHQGLVDRSRQTSLGIAARIGLLHVFVALVCCVIGGATADDLKTPVKIYAGLLVISAITVHAAPADAVSGFFVVLLSIPGVLTWLLVFFPGSLAWQSATQIEPSALPSPDSIPPEFFAEQSPVIVVAPLKPFGYIEFCGQRFPATCTDGSFVQAGETVQLCRQQGRTVIVRRNAPG